MQLRTMYTSAHVIINTENFAVRTQLQPDEARVRCLAARGARRWHPPQISKLTEMGFPRDAAIAALEASDGNENAALEYLLGGG